MNMNLTMTMIMMVSTAQFMETIFIKRISDNFTKRGSAGLITLGLVSVVLIAGIVGLIIGTKHFKYTLLLKMEI